MIWLIIFSTLSLIEAGYLWFQWDKISNIIEVTKLANNLVGSQLKDNEVYEVAMDFKTRVVLFIMKFKAALWIPIILILLANVIVATVVSIILNLILLLF